jgi:hypothetical protein
MASPAVYDFFRKIALAPDGITLEADSTTDTLTITRGNGVAFNPNASLDSFEIDVNYQLYVPIGTSTIRLEDVNSNTHDVELVGNDFVTVTRNNASQIEIGLSESVIIGNFQIGADDSTLKRVDSGESLLFLGTGGIATSSDAEGNITIDGSGVSSGALGSLSVTTTAVGTAALSYNSGTGVFTYTPPDLSSYLTAETNDLTSAVTWANVPDANITSSSVTQHQADLAINESQVTFTSSFIELTDLSVGTPAAASGSGSIAYNNTSGVFTYTPPDLSSYLTSYTETNDLTSAVTWANVPDANITESSVTQHEAALAINESQVTFTSAFIELTDLSVGAEAVASGDGGIAYNNTTGVFTYTPPDLSSYLTAETNDLTSAVTWANVPDANITESSVTQHEAALAINESQVTFTSAFIELTDLSIGTSASPSGSGSIAYNNTSGVFTFTPPDLSPYITAETDTLDSVTGRNASTTNTITVGGITDTSLGAQNEILIVGASDRITSSDLLSIDTVNERIGVGTASPTVKFDLVGEASDEAQIRVAQHYDGSDGPDVRFFTSRGTAAAPTASSANDNVGRISSYAYDGAAYQQTGSFGWNTSDASQNSYFTLSTRVSGTTANRLTVNTTGDVVIASNLTVNGQIEVSTIDSADSSAITVTPILDAQSDVFVGNNLYVTGSIDGYINLQQLKDVVAASVDFADFQARIANL